MQTPEHDTPRATAQTQAGAPRRQMKFGTAQVAWFVEAVGFNARPVQSVNHRLVLAPGGSQGNGH